MPTLGRLAIPINRQLGIGLHTQPAPVDFAELKFCLWLTICRQSKPASCIKPYTGGQKKARTKRAYER